MEQAHHHHHPHDPHGGHGHALHGSARSGRSILAAALLNFVITLAEITAGVLSGSLALISDALHNFSDAAGLVVAWFSARIAGRPADSKRTFGYRRAEILGALLNSLLLLSAAIVLVKSSVERLLHPEPVAAGLMAIVAAVCFAGNLASALFLAFGADRTLNVRAALAHILTDSLSSAAVIVGALIIRWTHWTRLDPLMALAIAVYASVQAVILLRGTVHILMQGAPPGVDSRRISRDLAGVPGVTGIHHIHLWSLGDEDIFFEAHISVERRSLVRIEDLKKRLKSLLEQKYAIRHSTLEFEILSPEECGECVHNRPEPEPPRRRPARRGTI